MSAFHAYDIRGVWNKDITLEFAFALGGAFATWSRAEKVLIAHDARLHSAELSRRLVAGLLGRGVTVTDIGLASTPQLHFYQLRERADAGIMVTASHNPKEYHGFKFFDRSGGGISFEKGLKEVERLMGGNPAPAAGNPGRLIEKTMLEEYVAFVAGAAEKIPARPVVIDAANGSAGKAVAALAEKLGMNAVVINAEPDGNFPAHDPNPLKEESRRGAREKVLETNALCGAVLDGDGDRIIFIDEQGAAVENYFMSALIAGELLERTPGGAIAYDLISSRTLPEYIREAGGVPVVSRVGYTHLHDRMVETGALFGAETSGHVYFKVADRYYSESALYALVIVLGLLERRGRPLSALLAPLRARYAQAPEVNVKVSDAAAAMREVERAYGDGTLDRLDGLSVSYPDFWFNVRPSNTEPLLRVRLEARNARTALDRMNDLQALLSRA